MKTLKCLTLIVAGSLFLGCDNEDQPNSTGQLIENGNVEIGSMVPNSWYYDTGQGKFTLNWSSQESFSPARSLEISTPTGDPVNFAFWGQTMNTKIPTGKKVKLKVRIKANLTGSGVSIAVRGDDTSTPAGNGEQFVTTQGTSPISGTFDWTEYSVTLDKVDASVKSLSVFLVYLPNTTGTVNFDNIELVY